VRKDCCLEGILEVKKTKRGANVNQTERNEREGRASEKKRRGGCDWVVFTFLGNCWREIRDGDKKDSESWSRELLGCGLTFPPRKSSSMSVRDRVAKGQPEGKKREKRKLAGSDVGGFRGNRISLTPHKEERGEEPSSSNRNPVSGQKNMSLRGRRGADQTGKT